MLKYKYNIRLVVNRVGYYDLFKYGMMSNFC